MRFIAFFVICEILGNLSLALTIHDHLVWMLPLGELYIFCVIVAVWRLGMHQTEQDTCR